MKAISNLPSGYNAIYTVNLQKDKKIAVLVNLFALAIGAVMIVPMLFFVPISSLFDMEKGILNYFLRFAVLFVSMILYLVLHEIVHGVTMKIYGTKKLKFGFTGLYAFCGSDDYYDKKSYITIALMPVIVFFVIFLVLNLIVPQEWFWVIYMLQVLNVSGAAGDIFVTAKFSKMPKDILINDTGVGMTVYSRQK